MESATKLTVRLIGQTRLNAEAHELFEQLEFKRDSRGRVDLSGRSDSDDLAEFAGRVCYQSFHKPNPATATNAGYLANILTQQHYSVLEHATATFYVAGFSRNGLLELERHRHLSLSVLSTRYVDPDQYGNTVHPTLQRLAPELLTVVEGANTVARTLAKEITAAARAAGATHKEARTLARSVLPGSTETRFVVTANMRAWRDVLTKRLASSDDAKIDQEIAGLAREILRQLKITAPNTFQDMEVPE